MELLRFSIKMAARKPAIPTVVSGTYKGKIAFFCWGKNDNKVLYCWPFKVNDINF
jgi:hypothetical protein